MTTYVITIKTLNVKLSFSIVHDKNLDDVITLTVEETSQGLHHVV